MLKWNLTWVLRFAPVRFICGLLLFVLSIYMLCGAVDAGTSNAAFVAAPFAFGVFPWIVVLGVGVVLVVWAWWEGQKARLGD
ncbi:hypothetical protein ABLT15_29790 [Paraburkholderia tropica]|uniref:hypothetical protein n=1 Tax=Paraburkholderia tropica TaxID=92647 RepID=UPI0032B450EB